MPQLIIHLNGAYNIYSTVSNGPHYESALTLTELEDEIRFEFGKKGIQELPERLERAHKTGCSSRNGYTLADCISGNRSGPGETELLFDEFVKKYLTLSDNNNHDD